MYLSELFLMELDEKYTREAVRKALHRCNDEVLCRLGTVRDLKVVCRQSFGEGETDQSIKFAELADFWAVFSEFDDMLSVGETRDILLMRLIYMLF